MPHALGTRSGMSFFNAVDDHDDVDQPRTDQPVSPRRRRRAVAALVTAGLIAGVISILLPSSAFADPSANDWYRLRMCESSNNYKTNTGNGHYGAYQFDLSTWHSVGGTGLPSNATPAEQDKRALLLWKSRGWQPWQCASIVGLTGGGSSAPTTGSHGYPGRSFVFGDTSNSLVAWQREMRLRGATILQGTGQYGPKTELVVTSLQRQNGLPATGLLGPQTWSLAWTGTFVPSTATRGSVVHVPAAPSTQSVGAWNSHVATWQKQMRVRGARSVTGTGEFGSKTQALVKALQKQNHVPATGRIDATSWKLAWTGSYHI
jgi:resuscitation-promoting factor RpfA